MRLVLVRHAESEGNRTGDYSTSLHDQLSERGHAQSARLAEALGERGFERVLVSPLRRACQTIAPWLERQARTGRVMRELAEACWQRERSGGERPPLYERAELDPAHAGYLDFADGLGERPVPGETFEQGHARVRHVDALLERWLAEGLGSALLVTHGHFLRELLRLLLGSPQAEFEHDNIGMSELELRGDRRILLYLNRIPA